MKHLYKTMPGILAAFAVASGVYLTSELVRSQQVSQGPSARLVITAVAQLAVLILLCIIVWKTLRRHRHSEAALKQDLSRVGSYIEAATVAIAVIDARERVTFINTGACAILGREKHEILV